MKLLSDIFGPGVRIRIARELGVTRSAVYQWTRVPVDRVLEVERITGVSRHVLRPDIYPVSEGPRSRRASSGASGAKGA
jgi:DNA-binding transcriptional regulator YdaS (Cro superfamily)